MTTKDGNFRKLGRGTATVMSMVMAAGDEELIDMMCSGMMRELDPRRREGKFGDVVFTPKFSAFDPRNEQVASSPFHGFFTFFWSGIAMFMLKTGAENWARHGSPLGRNEVMAAMFGSGDVGLLLVADAVMVAAMVVTWLLQRAAAAGHVDWDRSGWVLQNLWQAVWFGASLGLALLRDWPWTHTLFFALHAVVMLMKQHSYAFYNGHLSSMHNRRIRLMRRLKELDDDNNAARTPSPSPSDADGVARTLDKGQIQVLKRLLRSEADALTRELRGPSGTAARAWPHNLSLTNFVEFTVLPTLVYELEYPRAETIDWAYAGEKLTGCVGIIFVMMMMSQSLIYPVVMETVAMREAGLAARERAASFPRVLGELIFPIMVEYLLAWYLIWETILNLLAELTRFADRGFYEAWWNSASWDQFARDWNRPVHNFLRRHVYHGSISALRVDKRTATLMTFFLSACVHELMMWCIFKKLRGYLLVLQMCQLPLVSLSRTRWLRNKKLGNILFWMSIFTGPSLLCSLYLVL